MRETANAFKNIIVSNPYKDLGSFEETVVLAEKAGVTHVSVSFPGEKSVWEFDDMTDPYLNWSVVHNSVFKVIVPDILKEWVPADFARRNLELIKERCKIVKKYGLKASFLAYEPMWWPESVFEKYPHMRGSRVDHPRRSRHPRFSPDLFNDGVIDIYMQSIKRLLDEVPEIDVCIFSTNDSSTGLTWADRLYNSPNGPERGFVSLGENVAKFISSCEKAAAGSKNPESKFFIRGQVTDYELETLRQHLKGSDGEVKMAFFSLKPIKEEAIQGLRTIYVYPVKDIGQPFSLMRNLIEAKKRGNYGVLLNPLAEAYITEWDTDSLDLQVLRYFQEDRPKNDYEAFCSLTRMMEDIYGKEWGAKMLQAHSYIDRAKTVYSPMECGGTLLLLWVVAQRWITRPLVAFPEYLTDEEKAYFRKFQFQALTEDEADNPLETQGYQMVKGRHHGLFFCNILSNCRSYIAQAVECINQPNAPEKVVDFCNRLKCWDVLLKTCSNFIQFYTIIEDVKENMQFDLEGKPVPPKESNLVGLLGDAERPILYNLIRSEMDNTDALIALLQNSDSKPVIMAESAEKEDVFILSCELVSQLKTKKKLMMDHWLDLDKLLKRPNL